MIAGRGDSEKGRHGDLYIGAHCPLRSHAGHLRPEENHWTLNSVCLQQQGEVDGDVEFLTRSDRQT